MSTTDAQADGIDGQSPPLVGYPNPCAVCGAPPFTRCRSLTRGKITDTHQARIRGEQPDA